MRLVPQILYARKENLGANQSIEIQVGLPGSDFILSSLSATATSTFRFNIVPNDTSRRLFQNQVEATSLFTSVSAPVPFRIDGGPFANPEAILVNGLRVKRNTTISVELLDTSGAVNTIALCLIGFEVYA